MIIHVVFVEPNTGIPNATDPRLPRTFNGIITLPEAPNVGDIIEMPPTDPPRPSRENTLIVCARAWVSNRQNSILRVLVRPASHDWHSTDTWEDR